VKTHKRARSEARLNMLVPLILICVAHLGNYGAVASSGYYMDINLVSRPRGRLVSAIINPQAEEG